MTRLRVPAVILVGCIWTLAFVVGAATKDWAALGITTPVAMIAAGAVLALNRNGNNRNGNNKEGK